MKNEKKNAFIQLNSDNFKKFKLCLHRNPLVKERKIIKSLMINK